MLALDFNPSTEEAEPGGPCELESHPSLHSSLLLSSFHQGEYLSVTICTLQGNFPIIALELCVEK